MSDKKQDKNILNMSETDIERVFREKVNNRNTKFTIRFSENEMRKLEILQKKHNVRTLSELVRLIVSSFYEVEFKKKAH